MPLVVSYVADIEVVIYFAAVAFKLYMDVRNGSSVWCVDTCEWQGWRPMQKRTAFTMYKHSYYKWEADCHVVNLLVSECNFPMLLAFAPCLRNEVKSHLMTYICQENI